MMTIQLNKINCNFEREELLAPFGFKGGYVNELWQSAVLFEDARKNQAVGLGVQSILWSDQQIFTAYPQAVGNSVMFMMTAFAAEQARQISWNTPMDLLRELLPLTYEFGKTITGNNHMRLTFALNALVPVDNAAWLIYAKSKGYKDFNELIPESCRPGLNFKHDKLVAIPLITYGLSGEQIGAILNENCCVLKIKIGSDPDKDNNLDKMLEWDKQRISQIHELARKFNTPYTDNGKVAYYLDANGRYDSKDRFSRLLDHISKIGALDQVLLCEEPFAEENKIDVSDLPVNVVADESAHSDKDCLERIALGYKTIALKPIAKTMSMSLEIARIAHEHKIECFCADLTVNPIMVDWNKNVAARLKPLRGMKIGVLESNGHQNYKNWKLMQSYHPHSMAQWLNPVKGVFRLDEKFYECSGGIFEPSEHYSKLAQN